MHHCICTACILSVRFVVQFAMKCSSKTNWLMTLNIIHGRSIMIIASCCPQTQVLFFIYCMHIFQTLSLSLSLSVCVCESVCALYQRAATVESILNPGAKVDKKQWHQFSKIKRKPTVLLSASILEYKRGT